MFHGVAFQLIFVQQHYPEQEQEYPRAAARDHVTQRREGEASWQLRSAGRELKRISCLLHEDDCTEVKSSFKILI